VFCGAGAAAIATANMLLSLGVPLANIYMVDSDGLVYVGRKEQRFPEKDVFAKGTTPAKLAEVLVDADVFIGLSVGGALKPEMLQRMRPQPIIFAMANPDPEITYDAAKAAVPDAIIATGRSDFPNQVNNVLGFPFLFRGALDCRARAINEHMKVAAVRAIANLAKEDVPDEVLAAYDLSSLHFGRDYIIPKPFDPRVLLWVAPAVARAAAESGVARQPIKDMDAYRERLERKLERSKEILRPIMNRARLNPRRIVLPDGANPKVLRAAQILVDEGICKPILVGEERKILQRAERHKIDTSAMEIVEIKEDERFARYLQALYARRQRKGLHPYAARAELRKNVVYASMMVHAGDADGLVGGLTAAYADTIRPALQVIGKAPGATIVSGVYVMLFKGRRIFFGDCTVNRNPDAEQLAQIAMNTAKVAQNLGYTPRVAMLSYSDFGEQREDASVAKITEAIARVRKAWPSLVIDGEMQADTAVNPELAANDFPFSAIQGDANVLIFPTLDAGNIAYKLLRELGGATAVGPILVGLAKPVNVLALGSTVSDIVNMAAITVNQVLEREGKK
jgi:malate dehydrogenase (oxaloacetate-decarboxylating)(NADP+)